MSEQDDIRRALEQEMAVAEAQKKSADARKPGATIEGTVRAAVKGATTATIKSAGKVITGAAEGILDAREELKSDEEKQKASARAAHSSTGDKVKESVEKMWKGMDVVVAPAINFTFKAIPKAAGTAVDGVMWLAFDKDDKGRRTHFNGKRLAFNAAKVWATTVIAPLAAAGMYFYGTVETHKDIYVPPAGVFQNQNFVKPNGAGQVIAARDEIHSVLAKRVNEEGKLEEVRYDFDTNWFFMLNEDATRPDKAAGKLISHSPYGMKCDLETTGIYNRLPRFVRLWFVKWWDLRPEVIKVEKCVELKEYPKDMDRPSASEVDLPKTLSAPVSVTSIDVQPVRKVSAAVVTPNLKLPAPAPV